MSSRGAGDVLGENLAAIAPAVGGEVSLGEPCRVRIDLDEDRPLDSVPVEQRQGDRAHPRAQVEHHPRASGSGGEVREEERVHVHPVPFAADRLGEGHPAAEERIARHAGRGSQRSERPPRPARMAARVERRRASHVTSYVRIRVALPSVPASATTSDTLVRDHARAVGFDVVGVARADAPLAEDFARYQEYLGAGMNGEMRYLAEHAAVRERLDTDAILEGARSVVCLARRYQRSPAEEAEDPPFAQHLARYARGHDYHNVTRRKLRRLAVFLRSLGTAEAPVQARPIVDDAPLLERAWAARAGLGFVGKNGMLIVPGEGSFVLLGEVVTTLALTPGVPMAERCGTCTRCLDACPTRAFVRPFVLDARRCVAYLTIEHPGPVPEELRAGIGEHVFGCDDCQTVCPFNQSARPRPAAATRAFEPHARWCETEVVDLLRMDEPRWRALSQGSPVHRATADGLARNAAIVLGNAAPSEDPRSREALARAAEEHPSAMVREAAGWALARIERRARQGG